MTEIDVKFRTWYKGNPPKPIKLEIPGWAGEDLNHEDGTKPKPWHCPPFVAGSTYGLELIYPFDAECVVKREGEEVLFEADFAKESPWNKAGESSPPFLSFAPDHYGFTSSLDILPPEGYAIRTEPHPRFYTDTTGTCPIPVPGHIQRWWSRIFFIAFKAPLPGQEHIFRKGEPYAQILIVPDKIRYNIKEMTEAEKIERVQREHVISTRREQIASHCWKDHRGHNFDDKYKVLSNAYARGGDIEVKKVLNKAQIEKTSTPKKMPRKFFK